MIKIRLSRIRRNAPLSADFASGPSTLAARRRVALLACLLFAAAAFLASSRIGSFSEASERAYFLENGAVVEAVATKGHGGAQDNNTCKRFNIKELIESWKKK